jgi:hypothetical protein
MRLRRRPLLAASAVIGLALLGGIFVSITTSGPPPRTVRILEVEMRASAGSVAQLFWAPDLHFVEERSIRVPIQPGLEGLQRLRFPLPSRGVRWLRLDPTDAPAEILIGRVQLVDSTGRVVMALEGARLRPAHQIASITQEGGLTRIVTAPAATDPFLFATFGCADVSASADAVPLVTPAALLFASLLLFALIGASVFAMGVAAFGRRVSLPSPDGITESRWAPAMWLATLLMLVFAAKLLLMRHYPLTVPFWDQWDAEARGLYVPYSECGLSWAQMFSLHNEHRVFFTRLLALVLEVVNGQWDPRVQQVANAAIHALTAVLTASALWVGGQRRRIDLVVMICAVVFALPFAWENTLMAFQSAFYFLLLFFVLSLWLTTANPAGTRQWWLGWLCALCALFTAAGGVFVPVAIAAIVGLALAHDPGEWRRSLPTLGAAGAVLSLGIIAASPALPHHEPLRATTLADFAGTLGRNLAWPWIDQPQASVLLWAPLCALAILVILRRLKFGVLERITFGIGVWVVLQAAAIAYGRGAGAPVPAVRYQDFLSLGFLANTMAVVVLLLERRYRHTASRRVAAGAVAAWLVLAGVGMDRLVTGALVDLKGWRERWSAQTSAVRRFVITRDYAEFTSRNPAELPYPDAHSLASVLQDPYVRRILPASVREPVTLVPRVSTHAAFASGGVYPSTTAGAGGPIWGSFSASGNRAVGRFESEPVARCDLGGSLEFQVAGYLGLPGLRLAVRDVRSGREVEVRPGILAREEWQSARVSCPDGPYAIIAADDRPDYWFAFRAPAEVGRASPVAESLIAISGRLLLAALAFGIFACRRACDSTSANRPPAENGWA